MIEILTALVIWLFALTIFLFVRKLRRTKPMDEIKLQKIHVMRLGPFSGQSNSFKGKSVVFLMLLSTLSYAEVNLRTLDNFLIDDISENELTVAKIAEDVEDVTQLGFHISRPHCIPNYPYLLIEIPKELGDDSVVYAKISVDKNKPMKAKLYLEFTFDGSGGEKVGWFSFRKFPSFYNASKVVVKFQPASSMKNQTFILDGLKDSTYQAQQICNSGHMLRASNKQVKI
ncbi:hypothetical protein OAC45_02645 [Gammaproteobacteria bacterium]|nr:hypothetical protein [Gammaproteobacteria bacterium]|tara:strand:+ start:678 stop:1364 length:687 start_codon:yes stop_codon:yes gene_type:complete